DLGEGVGGLAKGLPKSLPLIRRFAAPSPRLRGEGTTAGLRDFEGGGGVAAGGGQPAVAAQLGEAQGLEALAVEGGGAGMELVVVAFGAVLAGEGLEEGDAAAEFGEPGQAPVEFARRQVVQHVATDQQVGGWARAQQREVGEAGEVQVAAA